MSETELLNDLPLSRHDASSSSNDDVSAEYSADSPHEFESDHFQRLERSAIDGRPAGLKPYQALVRESVENIAERHGLGDGERYSKSSIGASLWTSREKRLFFSSLDRYGPLQLARVAGAVGTKTTVEVRAYLAALEDGLDDYLAGSDPRATKMSKVNDGHAANEIGNECEAALDAAALELEQRLHQKACIAEKAKYGDDWIIDADRADVIEDQYTTREQNGQAVLNASTDSDVDTSTDLSEQSDGEPSVDILQPAALIALSRNIFMNNNADLFSRYDNLPIKAKGTNGPAIFRSAYEDLTEVCIDYAKRIVRAAHFQALTRVRARQDQSHSPVVRKIDVYTALDIAGLPQPDMHEYWRRICRRYELNVYSQAEQYDDGRAHVRDHGYKLSKQEVTSALARSSSPVSNGREQLDGENISDHDHLIDDDDSAEDLSDLSDDSSQVDQVDIDEEADIRSNTYLEAVDIERSRGDENNLREILNLPLLDDLIEVPDYPRVNDIQQSRAGSWNNFRAFRAEWEMQHSTDSLSPVLSDTEHKRRKVTMYP